MSFTLAAMVILGQVTAVLALTLISSRLFARRNAALNISVNLWGLSAALACPVIFAIVAAANVSWVTLPAPGVPEPLEIAALPEPVATPEPPAPAVPVTVHTDTATSFEATLGPVTLPEPVPTPSATPEPRFKLPDLGTLLIAIWAAGALFLAARLLHGWRVQARLRSTLKPADVDLSAIRESMGLRAAPPVTVSPRVGTPCSIGLLRPVLVLPEAMVSTLTPEALRDILIHECAHVLHRHHWVGLLQRIAALVFWPHPLVHVVNRGLSRRLEELCDNHVLESREATSYARTLLEVLEKSGVVTHVATGIGLLPPRWKIADRIAGLLDERRRIVTRARVSAALGIGTVLAAAGVALAGIRTADPAAPPLSEPSQASAPAFDEPLPPGALLRFGSSKFRHGPGIEMLAFSPDGKILAAGGNYGVSAWETATGKVRLQRMNCTGYVTFSPDGSLIAAGGGGDSVLLWNAATGEDVARDGLGKDGTENQSFTGMRPVTFSRDGKQIYSGGSEGNVRVFDSATGTLLRSSKGPAKSYLAAVVIVDGKAAAISSDGQKKRVLWDLETGAEILKFDELGEYPRHTVASPDGTVAAFTGLKPDPAGGHFFVGELWDLALKKRTQVFDDTASIALSRDGGTIATGDARGSTIRLREASTGKVLRTIAMGRGSAASLAFSPDGKILASASGMAVRLWDTASGKGASGLFGPRCGDQRPGVLARRQASRDDVQPQPFHPGRRARRSGRSHPALGRGDGTGDSDLRRRGGAGRRPGVFARQPAAGRCRRKPRRSLGSVDRQADPFPRGTEGSPSLRARVGPLHVGRVLARRRDARGRRQGRHADLLEGRDRREDPLAGRRADHLAGVLSRRQAAGAGIDGPHRPAARRLGHARTPEHRHSAQQRRLKARAAACPPRRPSRWTSRPTGGSWPSTTAAATEPASASGKWRRARSSSSGSRAGISIRSR